MTSGNVVVIMFFNGKHFFHSKQLSQITTFKLHNNGLFSWEFLNIPQNKLNASICDFCYNDTPDDNGKFYI